MIAPSTLTLPFALVVDDDGVTLNAALGAASNDTPSERGALPRGTPRGLRRAALAFLTQQDPELFARSEEVARRVVALAPRDQSDLWYWAGLLHDLGKLFHANEIEHPAKGALLLRQSGAPEFVVQAAEFHHYDGASMMRCLRQRAKVAPSWNGTGYPRGRRGTQIPLIARVIAVADHYAALTEDAALSPAEAWQEIRDRAETYFDPRIVARFLD